jgi:transcriptional regulator with XRE-family HTH domain
MHSSTMPRMPLNQHKPKTPLARLRREFLFHKNGERFYQRHLARDLEVTPVRIQQLELGTEALPPKHALKLQEIYGISADWLLSGNPEAPPVTPAGKPYSRVIAANSRRNHQIRFLLKEPTANLAWHLSLSLEALLSEIRTAIIRANQEKGLTAAASLFSEIRDAVLPPLKDAEPSASIVSSLHAEAERLLMSSDKYERHRLDLTEQHLGSEHPIIPGRKRKGVSTGVAQG